ncbi:hypothetical protein GRJ2_000851500 [Grus japonensis]|uniref:Uncharacterized protein n=1 Tax=Grus japonensis TaxID=30415 RepID=A0ABC9WHS9_GRUJA
MENCSSGTDTAQAPCEETDTRKREEKAMPPYFCTSPLLQTEGYAAQQANIPPTKKILRIRWLLDDPIAPFQP